MADTNKQAELNKALINAFAARDYDKMQKALWDGAELTAKDDKGRAIGTLVEQAGDQKATSLLIGEKLYRNKLAQGLSPEDAMAAVQKDLAVGHPSHAPREEAPIFPARKAVSQVAAAATPAATPHGRVEIPTAGGFSNARTIVYDKKSLAPAGRNISALQFAVERNDVRLAAEQVRSNNYGNINAVTDKGATLLNLAITNKNPQMVAVLLGAPGIDDSSFLARAKDMPEMQGVLADYKQHQLDGKLLIAAAAGHQEEVRNLLRGGAHILATDASGNTAQMLAQKNGHSAIADDFKTFQNFLNTEFLAQVKAGDADKAGDMLRRGAQAIARTKDDESARDLANDNLEGDQQSRMLAMLGEQEAAPRTTAASRIGPTSFVSVERPSVGGRQSLQVTTPPEKNRNWGNFLGGMMGLGVLGVAFASGNFGIMAILGAIATAVISSFLFNKYDFGKPDHVAQPATPGIKPNTVPGQGPAPETQKGYQDVLAQGLTGQTPDTSLAYGGNAGLPNRTSSPNAGRNNHP